MQKKKIIKIAVRHFSCLPALKGYLEKHFCEHYLIFCRIDCKTYI